MWKAKKSLFPFLTPVLVHVSSHELISFFYLALTQNNSPARRPTRSLKAPSISYETFMTADV